MTNTKKRLILYVLVIIIIVIGYLVYYFSLPTHSVKMPFSSEVDNSAPQKVSYELSLNQSASYDQGYKLIGFQLVEIGDFSQVKYEVSSGILTIYDLFDSPKKFNCQKEGYCDNILKSKYYKFKSINNNCVKQENFVLYSNSPVTYPCTIDIFFELDTSKSTSDKAYFTVQRIPMQPL